MPVHNLKTELEAMNDNLASGTDLDLGNLDISARSFSGSGAAAEFGAAGIKADVVAESTAAAGVTIDGVLLKDSAVDLGTSTLADAASNLEGLTVRTSFEISTGATVTADVQTGSSTGDGAAAGTLNNTFGVITTATQTTAAGAQTTLTLTNSYVATSSIVFAAVSTTGTGTPVVAEITPGSGSVVIVIQNIHATDAFNAALKVYFMVIKDIP